MTDTTVAYAQHKDIAARWIASTLPPDTEVINGYLEDATILIDAEFPDLRQRIATDPSGSIRNRARLVCCRMVLRVLTNPDQVRQVQDTTGPFSGSVTYAAETLAGLYLSDDDRALLSAGPARTQQAFTIDPTPTPRISPTALYTSQITGWPADGEE